VADDQAPGHIGDLKCSEYPPSYLNDSATLLSRGPESAKTIMLSVWSFAIKVKKRDNAAGIISPPEWVHLVPTGWLIKSSSGKMARRANQNRWIPSDGSESVSATQREQYFTRTT
jgi:hypothetical protein